MLQTYLLGVLVMLFLIVFQVLDNKKISVMDLIFMPLFVALSWASLVTFVLCDFYGSRTAKRFDKTLYKWK